MFCQHCVTNFTLAPEVNKTVCLHACVCVCVWVWVKGSLEPRPSAQFFAQPWKKSIFSTAAKKTARKAWVRG